MTERPGLTPSQTVGPYLSIGLLRNAASGQVVDPADPGAIRITGLLLDGAGEPVPDGVVEIWQAGPNGGYENGSGAFGRSGTVHGGEFAFVVRKPGRVPWPGGGEQAPHLAVGVFSRGLLKRLVTRMYFPDEEEANAADPVLARLDPADRATLVAAPDGDGALRFDIHMQGERQTTFFAV